VSLLVALTALLSLTASVTARTGMPGWLLLLLAGLAQQVLHLAFSLFAGTGGTGGTGSTDHGHGILSWQPQQLPSVPGPPEHAMEVLLYAHAAAALLTVLVIARWHPLAPGLLSTLRGLAGKPRNAPESSAYPSGMTPENDAGNVAGK
jgi:hypothetical protein